MDRYLRHRDLILTKYMPQSASKHLRDLKENIQMHRTLQAFRYQIAQAYWSNALSLQHSAQTYRELAQSFREKRSRSAMAKFGHHGSAGKPAKSSAVGGSNGTRKCT